MTDMEVKTKCNSVDGNFTYTINRQVTGKNSRARYKAYGKKIEFEVLAFGREEIPLGGKALRRKKPLGGKTTRKKPFGEMMRTNKRCFILSCQQKNSTYI